MYPVLSLSRPEYHSLIQVHNTHFDNLVMEKISHRILISSKNVQPKCCTASVFK